jgi:hypothetical protein
MEEFSFQSPSQGRIVVEAGFDTDGASIPRALRGVYAADGPWMAAAVIHDRLYWGQELPRAAADTVFLEGLTALGIPWARRQLFYRSVRAFGWINWQANAKKKASEAAVSKSP